MIRPGEDYQLNNIVGRNTNIPGMRVSASLGIAKAIGLLIVGYTPVFSFGFARNWVSSLGVRVGGRQTHTVLEVAVLAESVSE